VTEGCMRVHVEIRGLSGFRMQASRAAAQGKAAGSCSSLMGGITEAQAAMTGLERPTGE
jgi:hypothetical protein